MERNELIFFRNKKEPQNNPKEAPSQESTKAEEAESRASSGDALHIKGEFPLSSEMLFCFTVREAMNTVPRMLIGPRGTHVLSLGNEEVSHRTEHPSCYKRWRK